LYVADIASSVAKETEAAAKKAQAQAAPGVQFADMMKFMVAIAGARSDTQATLLFDQLLCSS
jgi:hypothetical protein